MKQRVVVVGAGVAGLVAALALAVRGLDVTVLERAATPGGKLREVAVGGVQLDAGPTVFTLRPVFEAIFADAGASLADHLVLHPAAILARHAWSDTERLDLFADLDRSADAIGALAGPAEARGYRDFCVQAQRTFATLDTSFMQAPRPGSPLGLLGGAGLLDLMALPMGTLWRALGTHFRDPRLRQLFGRYATYCGASPFQAPATLMLIAHVERMGVWLIEGGMHRLAVALRSLAESHGARFRFGAEVARLTVAGGRASGVVLADGESVAADAVVLNADAAALAAGLFGDAARVAAAPSAPRSLSALTWAMHTPTSGFPLSRHNVFFSADYASEFADIFQHARLPATPTVYVCAQDRDADAGCTTGPERLLCLVNAPPSGEAATTTAEEIERCAMATFGLLERCGLRIARNPAREVVTSPSDWARLYPATGGALYGPAMHATMAPFRRPAARSRLPGLYLAGGSVHPGAGLPMAALSGRQAASSLMDDLASMSRSGRVAMPGGMSMR